MCIRCIRLLLEHHRPTAIFVMHDGYDAVASAKQLEQIMQTRKATGECGTEAMQLHAVSKASTWHRTWMIVADRSFNRSLISCRSRTAIPRDHEGYVSKTKQMAHRLNWSFV